MGAFPIIDNHCHYQRQDGFVEQMLESGQAAGVVKFLLNGGGLRWRQYGNAEVMAAAERYPRQIIPVAFCYLGEHSAADVYAWYRAGFRALKTQCPSAAYDDDRFLPIYAAAEECRLPILFHTGISARFPNHDSWDTSSRYMMPLTLDRLARRFPQLMIWGAHLGVPDTWHAAMLMRRHPHVHFDLCGIDLTGERWSTICNYEELFYHGETQVGQLVFGSEGSPAGFGPLVQAYQNLLDRLPAGEETRRRVWWGNVASALGLEVDDV